MKKQIEQKLAERGYKLGYYDDKLDGILIDKEALDKVLDNVTWKSMELFLRVNEELYIVNIIHIENPEQEVDICLEDNEEYFSIDGTLDTALDYGYINEAEYDYYKGLNESKSNTILQNLSELVNNEFNHDEIVCCFEGDEQVVVSKVEGYTSNFEGFGMCQLYNAYYNTKEATVYDIWVDADDVIVAIGSNE